MSASENPLTDAEGHMVLGALLELGDIVTRLEALMTLPQNVLTDVAGATRAKERHYHALGVYDSDQIARLMRISDVVACMLEGK